MKTAEIDRLAPTRRRAPEVTAGATFGGTRRKVTT